MPKINCCFHSSSSKHTVNACPHKNQIHEITPNTHTFTEIGLLYIIFITNITTHETLTSSPRGWSDMTGAGPLWKKLSVKIEMFLEEYNKLAGRDINHHTNTLSDSSALLLFLNSLQTNCYHFEVIVIYKCNLKALKLMKNQLKSTQNMHHQNISTLFIRLIITNSAALSWETNTRMLSDDQLSKYKHVYWSLENYIILVSSRVAFFWFCALLALQVFVSVSWHTCG